MLDKIVGLEACCLQPFTLLLPSSQFLRSLRSVLWLCFSCLLVNR